MNKTLLASSLAAIFLAPTAFAGDAYSDGVNTVKIGGFASVAAVNANGNTTMADESSRINFAFTHATNNGVNVFAKLEWAVNPIGNSNINYTNNRFEAATQSDFLTNRLGYVGLSHDKYGTLTLGKQWGAWYDVVAGTDQNAVFSPNAGGAYTLGGGDGSVNGVGRGDKTIQYRNSFGDLSVAVQTQLKQNNSMYMCASDDLTDSESCKQEWDANSDQAQKVDYNYTYGLSLTYQATPMLAFIAGANVGEYEIAKGNTNTVVENKTDLIYGIGATWGDFDNDGFYAAVNANKNKNHDTDNIGRLIKDAYGVEALVSYKFDNGLRPTLTYGTLNAGRAYVSEPSFDPNNNDKLKRQAIVASLHYIWDDNLLLFVEGIKKFNDFEGEKADTMDSNEGGNSVAIGLRYTI